MTISLNPLVTTPFNADFNGDEMNIFTDMNLMSQAEMKSLCDSRASKSVQPIQDTITGSFFVMFYTSIKVLTYHYRT